MPKVERKRETRAWVRERIIAELSTFVRNPPDDLNNAPNPDLAEAIYQDEVDKLVRRLEPRKE